MTIQARRGLWTGGDEKATNGVLQFMVPLLYPDGRIPWEPMGCDWPEQVLPFIYGRDWAVRQADLYELGALRELVRHRASPELLARADDMDGCGRLELAFSHQSETLLTADLPQHSWMTLLGTPFDEAPDHDPDPVVAQALDAALSLAAEGHAAAARRRHVISELLLEVALTDTVCGRFSGSEHLDAWRTLAEVLPPPARERAEAMVLWCDLGLPRDIA